MNGYFNKEICANCGGQCCKRMPGCAFPEDFGIPLSVEALREALSSKKWAIDRWEGGVPGNEDGFYVRPAFVGNEKLFDYSWGGEACVFLTETGCSLPESKRPTECRMLEPKEHGDCDDHDCSKRAAAVAWGPYSKVLERIANELLEKGVRSNEASR